MTDPNPERIEDLEKQVKEMSGELDAVRQELAEAREARTEPEPGPAEQPVAGSQWLPDDTPAPPYGPGVDNGDTTYDVGDVARLGPAPRHVPAVFRLSVLGWRGWEMFTVLMVLVTPMAVWIFVPALFPVAVLGCLLVVGWFRVRRWRRWMRVLRWGQVATVTGAETHATSTSYSNVVMRTARGWRATSRAYSGSGYRSTVSWSLDETAGSLVVRGLPYDGGVVIATTREPVESLCVSELPFSVQPDSSGRLAGSFSTWQAIGVGLTVLAYLSAAIVGVLLAVATYTGP